MEGYLWKQRHINLVTITLSFLTFVSTEAVRCEKYPHCSVCNLEKTACTSCDTGYYGQKCDLACNDGCRNRTCVLTSQGIGNCTEGCVSGFRGPNCKVPCTPPPEICSACPGGCEGGYCQLGSSCVSGCKDGFYGSGCKDCSSRCKTCNRVNGTCDVCHPPYDGNGYFGGDCMPCSDNCANNSCNTDTGSCEGCDSGFYGMFCNQSCCLDSVCDTTTGVCSDVCSNTGDRCDLTCTNNCTDTGDQTPDLTRSLQIGIPIALGLLLLCIVIVCILRRKGLITGTDRKEQNRDVVQIHLDAPRASSYDYCDVEEGDAGPVIVYL